MTQKEALSIHAADHNALTRTHTHAHAVGRERCRPTRMHTSSATQHATDTLRISVQSSDLMHDVLLGIAFGRMGSTALHLGEFGLVLGAQLASFPRSGQEIGEAALDNLGGLPSARKMSMRLSSGSPSAG